MGAVKLHPRAFRVQQAEVDLSALLLRFRDQHPDVTDVEFLHLLVAQQLRTVKWMLREERHPGDPDVPADRA